MPTSNVFVIYWRDRCGRFYESNFAMQKKNSHLCLRELFLVLSSDQSETWQNTRKKKTVKLIFDNHATLQIRTCDQGTDAGTLTPRLLQIFYSDLAVNHMQPKRLESMLQFRYGWSIFLFGWETLVQMLPWLCCIPSIPAKPGPFGKAP